MTPRPCFFVLLKTYTREGLGPASNGLQLLAFLPTFADLISTNEHS